MCTTWALWVMDSTALINPLCFAVFSVIVMLYVQSSVTRCNVCASQALLGVATYGPFIFPENTQPISPTLWLCLLEEDVELKKPFQVILPHYLTGLSKERIQNHQVGFAKANHSNFTFVDNQMTYKFQHCVIEPQILHASSGYRNYGVLVSKHCCFYCLQANETHELALDAGYCVIKFLVVTSLSLKNLTQHSLPSNLLFPLNLVIVL